MATSIRIIDSHTGGEPTRLVLEGGPDLGTGPLAQRLVRFREGFDAYRSAIVNEPRGSDVLVGALLCPPHRDDCDLGVIFFNNVGYIGMCGHGTIGMLVSLAELGRLRPGKLRIETPVGVVVAELGAQGEATITNVPSYRQVHDAQLEVPGVGRVTGDIAWGGNWFFLVHEAQAVIDIAHVPALRELAARVRTAANAQGHAGVDHVELFGPAHHAAARSRNFVLCPGGAYDRSPCGTGTSAKLACLAAEGRLAPGEQWIQESVTGSLFTASYAWANSERTQILPSITGTAYVTAEAILRLDPRDPLCWGYPSAAS